MMTVQKFRCAHCHEMQLDIHAFYVMRGKSRVAMCPPCAQPALHGEVTQLQERMDEVKRMLDRCAQHNANARDAEAAAAKKGKRK
jgi:protein-arginine kinase activator protein McsA